MLHSLNGPEWSDLQWRRRLETFGSSDDRPQIITGSDGGSDAVCQPGELTDTGRRSTLSLGQRLRTLYVDQLSFMPAEISDSDMIYLRATPVPRALESLQQAFTGLYPSKFRITQEGKPFPPPTIITRGPGDETLFPNDTSCRRFAELSRAFAERTATRWNESSEMRYVSSKIGKWMPPGNDGRVKVDSHPRLSGVMDTINSTLAHGPATRLPAEFYDSKVREVIDKIAVEEWFGGYSESQEYRTLGIGGLVGDIVARMTGCAQHTNIFGIAEIGGDGMSNAVVGRGGEARIKFALSGCHDTTLAAALTSLGAFEGEQWPPYTSHIAFELFKKKPSLNETKVKPAPEAAPSLWSRFFGSRSSVSSSKVIGRTPLSSLSPSQLSSLEDHYVRIRYNDRVVKVPGCASVGNHLEGDDSFCTLKAFKAVVDDFTPRNWKISCKSNIGTAAFPREIQRAGCARE